LQEVEELDLKNIALGATRGIARDVGGVTAVLDPEPARSIIFATVAKVHN
jgi:hypothetical protein